MLPIHYLCANKNLDEVVAIDILTTLIETSPETVQRGNSMERLPIHNAARAGMSPEFLKILVNAYPQSVRISDEISNLPIHLACEGDNCRLDSVEYLLDVYPESIKIDTDGGWLPIHYASSSAGRQKADVIEHLLLKDPTCVSKVTNRGEYTLHLACFFGPNLSAVQLLFDAYPEAIFKRDNEGETPLESARRGAGTDVIAFLEAQLVYAERSQDMNAMTTLDQNGWLPLHHALKDKAPLGSIKLLVKGNTSAIRIADYNMAFPLHIACEFSSMKVVQYLMELLDERMKNHLDATDDSMLHYACRGGNCEVVKYLLDKQSPHVTERNADQKLPIHLFCQFGLPPNSLEYTDIVFRLLLAYPETL